MEKSMEKFNSDNPGSSSRPGFSRYFVNKTTSILNRTPSWEVNSSLLENVSPENRPDSPTGSIDFSETVRPSKPRTITDYFKKK
jgi:hypothetical protein